MLEALLRPDKVAAKKAITSIEDWVVCFNTYVSLVAMRKPERVRDLLAYSSTIVKASKDFIGSPCLDYDVQFRQQAATQPDAEWARIDASMWTVQFSRATPKPPGSAGAEKRSQAPDRSPRQRYAPYPTAQNRVCFRWNSVAGCQLTDCKFAHTCSRCRDVSHIAPQCPLLRGSQALQGGHPQQGPPHVDHTPQPFRPMPGSAPVGGYQPFRPPPGRR